MSHRIRGIECPNCDNTLELTIECVDEIELKLLKKQLTVAREGLMACTFSTNHLKGYRKAIEEAVGMGTWCDFLRYQAEAGNALKELDKMEKEIK